MSRMTTKTVSFSPDIHAKPETHKHGSRIHGKKIKVGGIVNFRLPKATSFSPVNFLKSVGNKVSRAFRLLTTRRRRSSSKVSPPNMGRSMSYTSQVESHHSEAIEDCIQFINASSSLQRSNSVSVDPWK